MLERSDDTISRPKRIRFILLHDISNASLVVLSRDIALPLAHSSLKRLVSRLSSLQGSALLVLAVFVAVLQIFLGRPFCRIQGRNLVKVEDSTFHVGHGGGYDGLMGVQLGDASHARVVELMLCPNGEIARNRSLVWEQGIGDLKLNGRTC